MIEGATLDNRPLTLNYDVYMEHNPYESPIEASDHARNRIRKRSILLIGIFGTLGGCVMLWVAFRPAATLDSVLYVALVFLTTLMASLTGYYIAWGQQKRTP